MSTKNTDLIGQGNDLGKYILNDAEYYAVYDWINAEKDGLPSPLKEGLLKLVNGEAYRRADTEQEAPR